MLSVKEELIRELKRHLLENDGEVAYWGEEIVQSTGCRVQGGAPDPVPCTPHSALSSRRERLDRLRVETIGDCHRCPLGDTRIKLVFGVGNPEARVMFVGEGPGYQEDRQGEPFVGKAGQLLDKILASIGLDRTKVYIANVVKCHPMKDPSQPELRGNDRAPQPGEMEKCLPFLREQIAIIRPEVVVALGGVAAKAILRTETGITRLRGRVTPVSFFDDAPPIPVLPTYHPAALLRDPTLKRDVWEDMKTLREMLNSSAE